MQPKNISKIELAVECVFKSCFFSFLTSQSKQKAF